MAVSLKNRVFYRFWNWDLAATSNPNLMVGTALERWKPLFYKNKIIEEIWPQWHFEYSVIEAVRLCYVQKFHLSSNIAEIKGDWGRLKFFELIFLKVWILSFPTLCRTYQLSKKSLRYRTIKFAKFTWYSQLSVAIWNLFSKCLNKQNRKSYSTSVKTSYCLIHLDTM